MEKLNHFPFIKGGKRGIELGKKSPLTPLFQRGEYSLYLLKIINNFRKRGGSEQMSGFIDGRLRIMSVQF